MTIRDLVEQTTIQGAYRIKKWIDKDDDYIVMAQGSDFECDLSRLSKMDLRGEITYIYVANGELNIEIEQIFFMVKDWMENLIVSV